MCLFKGAVKNIKAPKLLCQSTYLLMELLRLLGYPHILKDRWGPTPWRCKRLQHSNFQTIWALFVLEASTWNLLIIQEASPSPPPGSLLWLPVSQCLPCFCGPTVPVPSSSKILPLTWGKDRESNLTSSPGVSEKATRTGGHYDFKSSMCLRSSLFLPLNSDFFICKMNGKDVPLRVPGRKDKCTCLKHLLCYRYCSRPFSNHNTV